MKSLIIFFLAILTVSAFAASNDSTNYSVVKHSQATFTTLDDTTGLAIMNEGVGLISKNDTLNPFIILYKTENGVIAIVGSSNQYGDIPLGFSTNGKESYINTDIIVIFRKTFASHAEADAALISGEEYYLAGDRLTYHKP